MTRAPVTIHVLEHGQPLCRFSAELPRDWPHGHCWVDRAKAREDLATFAGDPAHGAEAAPLDCFCRACFEIGSLLDARDRLRRDLAGIGA